MTLNVLDFGAKGDGIADDTAEIQAAINAAYAAGGGIVYMPAGTYIVSGTSDKSDGCIRLLDNVTLQGAGMGLTTIRVRDDNPYAITGIVRTPFDEVTHDVGLFDLTIDGNRANNVNKIDGFYCGVAPEDPQQDYNITVERVEILNCTGYGFDPHEQTVNLRIANSVAHHNGLDGFVADYLIDSVFENNIAYANDRHGFNVTTSTDGLLLLNNTAHHNGSAGLVIQRGSEDIPSPENISVQGGSYYANTREGIYVKIANDITIQGVEVQGNQRQGIRIDGSTNVLIDGASIFNNSQAGTGAYDEIRLYRYNDTGGESGLIFDTTGVVVQNSVVYADGAVRSRFGIYESSDITGINRVFASTITGSVSGTTYFAPQLVTPAEDQTASAGTAFSYGVPPSSFLDGDGSFALTARLASGAALPSWLLFNAANGQFSGTPPSSGTWQIIVEARDALGLKDTTAFSLAVNGAPVTTINGTNGNDTLIGGNGPENINGLAGNDSLTGGGSGDRLDGGSGVDVASYALSATGVVVDLQAGTGSGGDAEGDSLFAIENLTGSGLADQLFGNSSTNVLSGGGGNDILRGAAGTDTLDGGLGADQLEGGDGNDLYLVDDAGDTITEFDNSGLGGTDTVRATISYALALNVENLTLLGTADINATGNNKGNILLGNSGANQLDGGSGNDTMEGGAGDDVYVVNTTSDLIIEAVGGGVDTIRSTNSRTLDANVENLILLGSATINGTGNALANILTGNSANNILTANDGNDTLVGGNGNDTLRGGLGTDTLDGEAGADRMEGGDGNDLYFVDNANDLAVEFANSGLGGIDTVRSVVTFTLASNVENLTLVGTVAIDGTGTSAANVLIGNDATNVLSGLAGNDSLLGGGSNDRLIGGSGSDTIDGGAGQDTAVYAGDSSTYVITTSGGTIQIRDNNSSADGNDGTDTLIGVETAEFKDGVTVNLLAPIVLDLDGDGIELVDLAASSAYFDFNGDGARARTGWIGSGDALLVLDRDHDGTVSNATELSFLDDHSGALSDLDGLRAFDTNGDGALSSSEDNLEQFLLWTDADGDGVAGKEELKTLWQAGITRIELAGNATEREWADGENIVVNYGSFLHIDGTLGTFADVAFQHYSLSGGSTL